MSGASTVILHYSAPPVIGGVESVIAAHVNSLITAGYTTTVIAGEGEKVALPDEADFVLIPEVGSQHPTIIGMNEYLEVGEVPPGFMDMVTQLIQTLKPALSKFDNLIVHNIFTKHFNLPLTVALHRLLDEGVIKNCIAWCHDITWTSPSSGSKVYERYPWDLLKTQRDDTIYVVVSKRRRQTLADLFNCSLEEIKVVYNGVDPKTLLGLSSEGAELIGRLGLLDDDLILLMPVRITQAKNIELAMKIIAKLKERGVSPKLVLTGPPDPHDAKNMEYYQSLQDLRRELGAEEEIRFVFESGPYPNEPYSVSIEVVGDLFRVSDMMFMPSHREGFGMPVLEAGLVGMPVISTLVPAAEEIADVNVTIFNVEDRPEDLADLILKWAQENPVHRHRREVRKKYTWQAIFKRDIEPLLKREVER